MELYGRDDEFAELRGLWQAVAAGQGPRAIAYIADTGVGKSRLVQELYHPVGAVSIRPTAPAAAASVTLAGLRQAVDDYRPNANQDEYGFQSLLAVRACNVAW